MRKLFLGILSFLILDFYFFAATNFVSNNIIKFIGILLFFPIAYFVAKFNGLQGLRGIGLQKTKRWKKHFLVSFLIGFGLWAVMYLVYGLLGKYDLIGVKTGVNSWFIVIQVIIGFFFGSLINDLITRGFIINILKGKMPIIWIGFVSIIIYALDDLFIGGFTLINLLFSLILGCSLTYSFIKSETVWADTGIHFGLNVAYGLLYGLNGNLQSGIFDVTEGGISPLLNNVILLAFASLMFIVVFLYYRKVG